MKRIAQHTGTSFQRKVFSSLVRSFPLFLWIIIITSIISILGLLVFALFPATVPFVALVPQDVASGNHVWTLLTHMFFHADILHLLVNMFSLFFLGSICESLIGKKRFFWFYIFSGLFAGVSFILFSFFGKAIGLTNIFGDPAIAGVGASGALFGLLGLLALLIPYKKVYLVAGPILVIILQVILPSLVSGPVFSLLNALLTFLLFVMIFSLLFPFGFLRKLALYIEMPLWVAPLAAIVPLVAVSVFVALPIGNSAHIGGLIFGLAYGLYLRLKYPRKVMVLGRHFQ